MKVKVVSSQVRKFVKNKSIQEPDKERIIEKIIACLSEILPTTKGLSEVRFIFESIF